MNRPLTPLDPQDEADLIDFVRGELEPAGHAALASRLEAEPGLAAHHRRTLALAGLERERFSAEHEVALSDAPRLAAHVISRVRGDEASAPIRARNRGTARRRWARLLAVSIGAHVVLLGFLAWQIQDRQTTDAPDRMRFVVDHGRPPAMLREDRIQEHLGRVLSGKTASELDALPDAVLRYDGGALDKDLEPMLEELVGDDRAGPSFRYPRGLDLAMGRRGSQALKRRRLAALGFDADGTLGKVRRGLNYLRRLQRPDGSFAAEAGRSEVYMTSLALLAFLGDGQHSKADAADPVVKAGITWLRRSLRRHPGHAGPERGLLDQGVALVALSEDYMLTYGRLGISEARQRGTEIRALAAQVEAGAKPQVSSPVTADLGRPWPIWALHAAERTGLIERTVPQRERFDRWVAAAAGQDLLAGQAETLAVLTQGMALLAAERGARKPRFLSWSGQTAAQLLSRLLPNGKAKGQAPGARVAATAVTLLALQMVYRTY